MARVTRRARAEADLIEIWSYIAEDNPQAADQLLDKIDEACARLAEYPYLGRTRPDLAEDLRHSVIGRYLILYREIAGGIEIIRVLHGARHLPDLI
jgi:toxin ParE1/3/4